MTFKASPQQQTFFDWVVDDEGNAVLIAVAGAGKTTTIIQAIPLMQVHPVNPEWKRTVLIVAFNKKMADELKDRIKGMVKVYAGTFHSQGLGLLKDAFGKDIEVDAKKVIKLLDAYMDERKWNEKLQSLSGAILATVSMAKNRGLLPDSKFDRWINMIDKFDLDQGINDDLLRDGTITMEGFVATCRTLLEQSNKDVMTVDYDDMIYLPVIKNVEVRYPKDWVLVDEAQDTNPMRRKLAEMLLKPRYGRLVAVGDPHQAIFGFTGADNDALDQIVQTFNAKTMPLSVTYRCPKTIVNVAKKFVNHIEAHETAPDGEVTNEAFEKLPTHLTDRSLDSETAIVCRYNRPLVSLVFSLIRKGIPAKLEGRDIGEGLVKLCRRWKTNDLITLEKRIDAYREREIKKALQKDDTAKADRIDDQVATLFVMIDRARELKETTVDGLVAIIRDMFADNVRDKGMVTLSSVHKSKGLEWDRVFILGRHQIMPSPMAKQPWQIDQEINLIYVAVTRAKEKLIDVDLPPKEDEDRDNRKVRE